MKKAIIYGISSIILLVVFYLVAKGSIDWLVVMGILYFHLFFYLFSVLKSKLGFFLLNLLMNALFFYLQDTDLNDLTGIVLFTIVFSFITYGIFWFVSLGTEKQEISVE